jgi:hypothetical protein
MSIEILSAALKVENLTPTKKLILIVLANYADENGTCYPSYKHIAKIVGLKDHKGIQKTIKDFQDSGLLEIETRYKPEGGQTSNRYHLNNLLYVHPSPHRVETPPPTVLTPPNTKEDTKDNNKQLYDDEFSRFWSIYPRKVGKYNAYRSWKKAIKDLSVDDLVVSTKNFAQSVQQTEEKYIPHAQTWLNGKRYLDVKKSVKNSKNNLAG